MSFISTIPPDDATGAVAEMYLRLQAYWGYVPNYAKPFSHRPELMACWMQMLAEIKRPMTPRRYELVTFAAAHELRNSACTFAHGQALREFFSDDDIVAMADGRVDMLEAAERPMVVFARQVARDAGQVSASHVGALQRAGFTDVEIFDIAAAASVRSLFAKLLDATGVLADATYLQMPERLRDALTVGRPIDRQGVARMPTPGALESDECEVRSAEVQAREHDHAR